MLLEKMKKGVGKVVITVLAVLLIISFAVWGIGDMVTPGANYNQVAEVDGTSITQREFQEQFQREMNRIRARIGNIDAQQARNLGLADSTLDGLIARRLLGLQAADLGLLVSDEQVIEAIQRQPAFRNALGQFDRSVFQVTLANNGISEGMYVASLRQDTQQDYIGGVITAGAAAPPQLAETVFRYRNERRSADVINVKRAPITSAPTPTDTDLNAYLEKNVDQFRAPEYRRLSILHMDPDQVAKELSPSAEQIQREYEDRLSGLSVPERRRLEQILIKDEAAAKKAHASLSEGRSFEAVSKETTGKSGDDVKLGLVTAPDLLPDLATAAFAVQKGQFTQPTKSPLGWHILRVTEIQAGREPKLAEVRKEIVSDLSKEMALDDLVTRANRVEDALAGGSSIEDASQEAAIRVTRTEPIDVAKKLLSGTAATGLPKDTRFMETAFSLKNGATSDLIETADGGYFMVRVDEVVEAAKRPLNQVRTEVETAWKTNKLNEIARKTAESIRDAAKGGTPLSEAGKKHNLLVANSKPVSRFGTGTDTIIPRALLPELFKAKTGGIVMQQTADGFAVARLKDIENNPPSADDGDFKRLQETLTSAMANDVLSEYTRALRNEYSVSVNQAGLEAYFSSQSYGGSSGR
ncbi:MAG: peptidyl-prolyl cis-trans isomerase D [Paracoccaceae bacterium]|jgi:peptidyl-prolyl cis-trans isomerase D